MEKTIYSTFADPGRANQAFVELIQRGASYMDLVVITKRTYKDPAFDFEGDGRLEVPETIPLDVSMTAEPGDVESIPQQEDLPERTNPFGDTPGGMWLLDNLRYPGDLSACLRELGFLREAARNAEEVVLGGGAVLILRVPSGSVDDAQGWQTMERHGGAVLAPNRGTPYLG